MKILKSLAWLLTVLVVSSSAYAQSQGVQQSGPVTPGHAGCWTTNGVLQDCGVSTNGYTNTFGITANGGTPFCITNTKVRTGPYYQMCMGISGSSAAISINGLGGGTAPPFSIIIDGVPYTIPGTLGTFNAVATRTQMAGISPVTSGLSVYLTEAASPFVSGREGVFTYTLGNFCSLISADTLQGVYVLSGVSDCSVGAWVRNHVTGVVEANWFGALFNWTTGTGSPSRVAASINAAINLVIAENQDNVRFFGGRVILPKGAGYFDDVDGQILDKDGVRVEGQGPYTTMLVWGGTRATQYPIWLGNTDHTSSFSCGLRNLTVYDKEDPTTIHAGDVMIYTETCQQADPILEKVYLFGSGARIMFDAEIGYGGAAQLVLRDVDSNTTAGSTGSIAANPIMKFNYGGASVQLQNVIMAGSTDSTNYDTYLLEVDSGTINWLGGECEITRNCVYDNLSSSSDANVLMMNNIATGNFPGAGTSSIVSIASALNSEVRACLFGVGISGATHLILDNRNTGTGYNGGTVNSGAPNPSTLGPVCR